MPSKPSVIAGGHLVLALALVVASALPAAAQEPIADGFNPGANGTISAMVVQTDGRILVGGEFTGLGGGTGTTSRNRIGRLNADGTVDSGFNPGANGPVFALAVQSDGKILVGGSFTMLGGGGTGTTTRHNIGRLNADGSLDTTFDPGSNGTIGEIALQPDGRILVGGNFTMLGGGTGTTSRAYVGRLNVDGSVDPSFNAALNGYVGVILPEDDGRIVVGGSFTIGGGLVRLNTDGSFNAAPFSTGFSCGLPGSPCPWVSAVARQADGGYIVAGMFYHWLEGPFPSGSTSLIRIGPGGQRDTSFTSTINSVQTLTIQPDGKILVGGTFNHDGRHALVRLEASGAVDPSFNAGASSTPFRGDIRSLIRQPDGSVLVAGNFNRLGGGGAGTTPRLNIGRLIVGSGRSISIGLDPFSNGGWFATRRESNGDYLASSWKQVPWPAFASAGGSLRLAAGDVDGDGLDEIVAGLGPGGGGYLAIFDDAAHGHNFLTWLNAGFTSYNAANGETWPAVGDIDSDGRDEIVVGFGNGGAGWYAIFDDASSRYVLREWRRTVWHDYNTSGSGATHPAVVTLADGLPMVVVGLGTGGGGWLQVDMNSIERRWIRVDWPTYNARNGATFPAAGDVGGDDAGDELVIGLGAGGAGWLAVLNVSYSGHEHDTWLRTSWGAYNSQSTGETHPAVGNLDNDGRAEIAIGLARYGTNGGWVEVVDDASTGYRSTDWLNVEWSQYQASGGGTYPTIGRFR